MKILLIRHAIAEDQSPCDRDRYRRLTEEGKDKFHRVCKKLKKIIPEIKNIYSSEFVRAKETAGILHEYFPNAIQEEVLFLNVGESFDPIEHYLPDDNSIYAFVGHEPSMSYLSSHLMGIEKVVFNDFKKGSVLYLEGEPGYFKINWYLTHKLS